MGDALGVVHLLLPKNRGESSVMYSCALGASATRAMDLFFGNSSDANVTAGILRFSRHLGLYYMG